MRPTYLSYNKVMIDSFCKAFIPCHVAFTFYMPVIISMQRNNMLIKCMFLSKIFTIFTKVCMIILICFCFLLFGPVLTVTVQLQLQYLSSNSRIKIVGSELGAGGVLNLNYFSFYC